MTPRGVVSFPALVVLAAVLAIVGCGEDHDTSADGSTPTPEGAELTVRAHDIGFDRDDYELTPGEHHVAYLQEGETRHTLLVETADGAAVDGFELEVDGHASDVGTIELDAGQYTLYCDIAGHREAGMEADLVVG